MFLGEHKRKLESDNSEAFRDEKKEKNSFSLDNKYMEYLSDIPQKIWETHNLLAPELAWLSGGHETKLEEFALDILLRYPALECWLLRCSTNLEKKEVVLEVKTQGQYISRKILLENFDNDTFEQIMKGLGINASVPVLVNLKKHSMIKQNDIGALLKKLDYISYLCKIPKEIWRTGSFLALKPEYECSKPEDFRVVAANFLHTHSDFSYVIRCASDMEGEKLAITRKNINDNDNPYVSSLVTFNKDSWDHLQYGNGTERYPYTLHQLFNTIERWNSPTQKNYQISGDHFLQEKDLVLLEEQKKYIQFLAALPNEVWATENILAFNLSFFRGFAHLYMNAEKLLQNCKNQTYLILCPENFDPEKPTITFLLKNDNNLTCTSVLIQEAKNRIEEYKKNQYSSAMNEILQDQEKALSEILQVPEKALSFIDQSNLTKQHVDLLLGLPTPSEQQNSTLTL